MSAGFRAGTSNDGYLQINGTDILTVSSGVLGVKNTGAQSEVRLYCESNNAHYASLKSPPHSDFIGNVTFTLPGTSGSSGQVLQTDGSGNLSFIENVNILSNLSGSIDDIVEDDAIGENALCMDIHVDASAKKRSLILLLCCCRI